MGTLTKGDIVLYPFPYTDLSSKKLRPCLVLSEKIYKDFVLCQITSKNIPKDEFSILLKKEDKKLGNLRQDSLIRTNMLFTAEIEEVVDKVCKIDDKQI